MTSDEPDRAQERARKILRADKLATFDAWTLAVFAGLTLLFSFGSVTALVVGAGLLALSWVEFRGRKALRDLDPQGPRILGWNQVALFVLIAGYCLWSIRGMESRPPEELETAAALAGLPVEVLVRIMVLTYWGVIGVSLVLLGLAAWFYWRRGPWLREHLAETSEAVLERQREAAPDVPEAQEDAPPAGPSV